MDFVHKDEGTHFIVGSHRFPDFSVLPRKQPDRDAYFDFCSFSLYSMRMTASGRHA